MAFNSCSFVYDGVTSDSMDLIITSDGTGRQNSNATQMDVISDEKNNGALEYYGKKYNPLSFTLEIHKKNKGDFNRLEVSNIKNILLRGSGWKELKINETSLNNIVYMGRFISVSEISYGNKIYGFVAEFQCKTAGGIIKNQKHTILSTTGTKTFSINNTGYTKIYPIIEVTTSATGTSFTLTNNTDNTIKTIFTGLSNNETLTIDCKRGTITSSTGLKRVSNFNKIFFELLEGINNISLTGNLSKFELRYDIDVAVGN